MNNEELKIVNRQEVNSETVRIGAPTAHKKVYSLFTLRKRFAFTLAEVLITLGVIGVVAALTMPVLIQKQNETATVVALKKFYSVLNQAINLNLAKNPDDYSAVNIMKNLKAVKICEPGDTSCITKTYKRIGSSTSNVSFGANDEWIDGYYTAQLADGMLIRYNSSDTCTSSCGNTKALQNVCGEFGVDINGDKGPNRDGHDLFFFYVTKYGAVPFGSVDDTYETFSNSCNLNATGNGCAAWVIYNGNMDYLHCRDELSWNGKTKCD